MANTVISAAVNFVETHRFRFRLDPTQSPSPDPTTWVPVADSARGAPKGKIVYIFMSAGGAPFQLLKACSVLTTGELQEVSAADALQGNFKGGSFDLTTDLPLGDPGGETRLPEAVQAVPFRYFFYVSRHILDGSFITDLAANPRPELKIRTLDGLTSTPATIAVTDPLTIAEQLAIEYEKLRRAYMALCAPFDEQSAEEKQDTVDLIKQRMLAQMLQSVFAAGDGTPSSSFAQQPDVFLKNDLDDQVAADLARDIAAIEAILWFDGPLMTFARQTYGADGTSSDWAPDFHQLVACDGAVLARLADSYRGMCLIRTKISQSFYFTREFIGRPDNVPGSLAKVQATATKTWDIVTKTWTAIAYIMAALEPRVGPRAVDVNSAFVLSRMVFTYNTVFGQGLLTITRTAFRPSFTWRDTGQPIDVTLNDKLDSIVLKVDGRIQLLAKAQTSPKFPYLLASFEKGIAGVNFIIAVSAAVEALRSKQAARVLNDDLFNVAKLMGSMVNTASFFPNELARLFNLTGRGVASISLLAGVMTVATGIKDTADSYKKGDFNAQFGQAISTLGGLASTASFLLVALNSGVFAVGSRLLGIWGVVLYVAGQIIVALCTDDDMDLFVKHCFLGERFGEDSGQPSWSPAPFENWSDDGVGLDHQLNSLFNLVFAYQVTESLSRATIPNQTIDQLVIDYGTYPAGATFEVQLSGNIQNFPGPAAAPIPFAANMVIDPVDPRFSSGTSALVIGSVQVSAPAQKIIIVAVPVGMNPLTQTLAGAAWQVRMNTVVNPVQPGAVTSGRGYVVAQPATVPSSGATLKISGLTSFATLSTEIP